MLMIPKLVQNQRGMFKWNLKRELLDKKTYLFRMSKVQDQYWIWDEPHMCTIRVLR
ncbi:hypothetical protein RHGRI_007731 [Rhododendron griersonianum]|uniref:Uncharacterized protein n=1 Tax=Rhododendron griersonianum TaxID=479676 RepID=A0AAV6KYR2_9ERIC|nr:hypothetical protein RHGRI_007730 [Rhododendron griersonianum]KAG5557580.1 hypothetical protein RHGRI_007731 [Rhododendron griersonianum]